MNEDVTYKVLWVDDKIEELIQGAQLKADDLSLELEGIDNWEDAENKLVDCFDDYSAIILDADCCIKSQAGTSEHFINNVLPSLKELFGKKQRYIPWYILSAGTMKHFDFVIEGAKLTHQSEDWGEMLYFKDDPQSVLRLFETIRKVAAEQSNNIVLFRYRDIFEYLGENKLIDNRARKIMQKTLGALYYPEENIGYEYQGNPLRKMLEYIFRSARKQGLLSPLCFDKDDHVNLTYSSLYMKGDRVGLSGKELDYEGSIRWGMEGDYIFPANIANIIRSILFFANVNSHTYEIEDSPYYIDDNSKQLFFGYVLQLCYVIKWYGEYANNHTDVEKNRCMQVENITPFVRTYKSAKDYDGARLALEKDDNGNYHCGECSIYRGVAEKFEEGEIVELFEPENKGYSGYKYSAKIKKVY